ncbi:MAG: glycosyltransferase [Gammaproteobacteria bacterium]|nr:glycosyltransferase [Gammaproteobacteria bacterium]
MNTLRISCIIPAFNSERFLAEAIARVLAQTLPVYEIIVVGAHPRMPA